MDKTPSTQEKSKVYNTDRFGTEARLAAAEDSLLQGSSKSLTLLHDHIKDITSVVRRLSRDMDQLEGIAAGSSTAITALSARIAQLESAQNDTTLTSRLNRCDIGITELARDVKDCRRGIARNKQSAETAGGGAVEQCASLEARIRALEEGAARTERTIATQDTTIQEQRRELGAVSGSVGDTLARDMASLREGCLARTEALVAEVESRCEAQLRTRDQQIETLNEGLSADIARISRELDKMKLELEGAAGSMKNDQDSAKTTVTRLRSECMAGFKTLQESVDTIHSILDSKISLVEEELRAEMKRAIKTVVLT